MNNSVTGKLGFVKALLLSLLFHALILGISQRFLKPPLAIRRAAPSNLHGILIAQAAAGPNSQVSLLSPHAEFNSSELRALHNRGENDNSNASDGYYPTSELDIHPEAINEIDMDALLPPAISGEASLALWINENGEIDDVTLLESTLNETDSALVINGFKALRFTAGWKSGVQVKSVMQIRVSVAPQAMRIPLPR